MGRRRRVRATATPLRRGHRLTSRERRVRPPGEAGGCGNYLTDERNDKIDVEQIPHYAK